MPGKLEGKIALVTGGRAGIGLATAQRFVKERAYVYITERRQSELDRAVKTISTRVNAVRADTSSLADLDKLFAQIRQEMDRPDVVFANAGGGSFAPLGAIAALLRLFERRLFLARWTDEIIEETVRSLRDKLGRTREQTDHLVNELRNHFPDVWVEQGYRELIPAMTNQEKDRHVLAAAVKTPCVVIVTYNLKHFPEESLNPFGITAKHPDESLIDLYHLNGEIVVHELHQQGTALRTSRTISEVLASLETCKCAQFAQLIRERLAL
jgi:hypothetical protein